MTRPKSIAFAIFVFLVLVFVVYRWHAFWGGSIEQPLEFNHKVHTELLKCEECHTGAINSASATIPNIKMCMGCHQEEPMTQSKEEIKLINYIKNGQHIDWQRLYKNPVHVYFPHNRHVAVGKVECETCHGNMGQTVKPPRRALIDMDMDYCISCHKKNNVDQSCIVCHK